MNRYRMQFAPQVWKPTLNPLVVSWLRPWRLRHQRRTQRLMHLDLKGSEHVQQALAEGCGVAIMPNHSSHADPFTIYMAADEVGTPLYVMATWHVFHDQPFVIRWLLKSHGCFSVDREANDIGAFRQAVEILENRPQPLVIFPEGEIYHCNDRVTPFREGAAAIAIAAARRAKRRVVCVPCAITYRYVEDPTDQLVALMGDLEESILWKRQPQRRLDERIYRFAEALLVVKELEYLGHAETGPLPERIQRLAERILLQVEQRHGLTCGGASVPERVKCVRKAVLDQIESANKNGNSEQVAVLQEDLEDVFLVVQSFSYPGDYVSERPTVERMAETLDKFEEDVLRRPTASIRGSRKVLVQFGEPVTVVADRKQKSQTSELSQQIEERVQKMLDSSASSARLVMQPV